MREATRKCTALRDAISVLTEYVIEGDHVLHVICLDYDHLKKLPQAVSFGGKVFGRTGWNSDSQEAYYKDTRAVAFPA